MDMYLQGELIRECMVVTTWLGEAFDLRITFDFPQHIIFQTFMDGGLSGPDFVRLMISTGFTAAEPLLCMVDNFVREG